MSQVLRWDVHVDDRWHTIGGGPVALVESRPGVTYNGAEVVEVWTIEDSTVPPRKARVYGTGHHVPAELEHLGSVAVPGVRLVWHLFAEKTTP